MLPYLRAHVMYYPPSKSPLFKIQTLPTTAATLDFHNYCCVPDISAVKKTDILSSYLGCISGFTVAILTEILLFQDIKEIHRFRDDSLDKIENFHFFYDY